MGPDRLSLHLCIILLLTIFCSICNANTEEWCPTNCKCMVIPGKHPLNHAKCSSLTDLMESKNLPIHSLDLSHANLTKANHLDKLRLLRRLNLSHNRLSDIGTLGLRVKSINLSHNKITSAKLSNIPKTIEDLDLSYNEITYLPSDMLKMNLKRMELFGNKINCTCETLEVRNWLAKNSVFTSHPVKCTYPSSLKGILWMQIKQDLHCGNSQENGTTELGKKFAEDNENELMLGDAPALDGSGENNNDDDNEELGKDYMPINTNTEDVIDENVEGSGLSHMPMQNEHDEEHNETSATKTNESDHTDEEDNDEGSGGGIGVTSIPIIYRSTDEDESESNATSPSAGNDDVVFAETEKTNSEEPTPIPIPTDESALNENDTVSFGGLGIYRGSKDHNDDEDDASESPIVPMLIHEPDNQEPNETDSNTDATGVTTSDGSDITVQQDIDKAETSESNSTYILLGTIVIILICLLMYIGLKKMIAKNKRQNDRDAERAAELVDMDKKNLGKPLIKNDPAKPTTNGNHAGSKKPYTDNDTKTQVPLLNGHNNKEPHDDESNNNLQGPQSEEAKIPVPEPRQSLQQPQQQQQPSSPRIHSPRFGGYPPPRSPRSPDATDRADAGSPSSPKAGRYSPVYSPETGKVKIRLTEVPKPKTPMLVTRSRSNAGEILTTPTSDEIDSAPAHKENK